MKETFDGHIEIDANGPKGAQTVRESGGSGDVLAPLSGPRGERRGGLQENERAQEGPEGEDTLLSRDVDEAVNPDGARDVEILRAEAHRLLGKDAVVLEAKGDLQYVAKAFGMRHSRCPRAQARLQIYEKRLKLIFLQNHPTRAGFDTRALLETKIGNEYAPENFQ